MMDLNQLVEQACLALHAEYTESGGFFRLVVPLEDDFQQEVLVHLEKDEENEPFCLIFSWSTDLDPDRLPGSLDLLLDLLSRNEEFLYARLAWDPENSSLKILAKHSLAWLTPELFEEMILEVAEEAQFLEEDFGEM